MDVVILSDTHVPRRARDLPAALWEDIDRAGAVVHAGDWVSAELVDEIASRVPLLVGCWGNNDGPDVRERLPEVGRADLAGLRVAVVHDSGQAGGRERRCAARFPDVDLLVFGHSHVPWDTTAETGLRLLNPGSPTDRRRQPAGTWITATVAGGRLAAVAWHEAPQPVAPRGDRP